MKLIEDLGLRAVGSQGRNKSFGLYECPICHKHFECITANVKKGNTTKCRSCASRAAAKDSALKAAETFIEKARAIHGDLYEYLLTNYVDRFTKVKIMCKVHGVFKQTPSDHLRGRGCPNCAKEHNNIALRMSEKNDKPTILYYVYFPEVNLWKVGCTTKTIEERFSREALEHEVLETKEYASGNEAYRVEKFILEATKESKFTGKVLGTGNTELRTQPIENFDIILQEAELVVGSTIQVS